MPFVPVPNTVELESVFMLDGQIVEITNYFFKDAVTTPADLAELADAWSVTIKDHLLPFLANSLALLRIVAKVIDAADGIVFVSTLGLPANGLDNSEAVPSNVAATLSFRTGVSGRSFRGRNYLPGIPSAAVAVNTLSTDFTNGVAAAYSAMFDDIEGIGYTPVVVSRYSGFTLVDGKKVPTPRVSGLATAITSHFFVDRTVDSQRRRLPGRGN